MSPIVCFIVAKDSEKLFDFLIDVFCFCEEPTNGPFRYSEAQGDGAGSKCEQGLRGEEWSRTKR
jgi:hypothetical protein